MTIGYARISTADQSTDLQTDALRAAGCERIFTDVASGAKASRPQLDAMLVQLRPGDTVTVWRLDRLARSVKHLVELSEQFTANQINLRSITEGFDTGTAAGKLLFHVLAAVAEMERNLIRERTNAGLEAARSRGRKGGRPSGLSPEAEITSHAAASLYKERQLSVEQICKQLSIKSKATFYRYLRVRGVEINGK